MNASQQEKLDAQKKANEAKDKADGIVKDESVG